MNDASIREYVKRTHNPEESSPEVSGMLFGLVLVVLLVIL